MSQIVRPQASLVYNVMKQEPELLSPEKPTPYEFKELSDIDDQKGLRLLVPGIQFYRSSQNGLDPVKVIREALKKVLVLYYPLAGRLREREDGRLVVECNEEGIMFIEADADVSLAEFGEPLCPPFHFPIMDELFCDSYDIDSVMNYPLFLIQVTRLRCGGFIIAHKINHIVCDGSGLAQFMQAVAEVARGAKFPSVHPVWKRDLLQARNPPQINYDHREYDVKDDDSNDTVTPFVDVVHKSFFFGPSEIAAIRRFLPTYLKSSSTFEVLSACIWRSRSISLQLNADEEVRFRFFANTRHKFNNPPLPKGYYGNVIVTPVAISTAEELSSNPLGYALTLIKSAKANVTEDYTKSLADFLVSKNRPRFSKVSAGTYAVSDVSRVRLDQWDFGWGTAVFGGPAKVWSCGPSPGFGNYFLGGKNSMGETGTVVPMWLPRFAMDRFVEEINGYLSVAMEQPVMTFGSSIVNERSQAICT